MGVPNLPNNPLFNTRRGRGRGRTWSTTRVLRVPPMRVVVLPIAKLIVIVFRCRRGPSLWWSRGWRWRWGRP